MQRLDPDGLAALPTRARPGSLVGRLTVFLVGFVVVATVIVVVREYGVGEEGLVAETRANLLLQATLGADRLEEALAERARMIALWASLETSQDLAVDDVDKRVSESLAGLVAAFGDGSEAVAVRGARVLSASDPTRLAPEPPPLPPAVRTAVNAPIAGVRVYGEDAGGVVVVGGEVLSAVDRGPLGRIVVWTPLDRFLATALPLDFGNAELVGAEGTILARGDALREPDDAYLWARHTARSAAGDLSLAVGRPRAEITRALQASLRQLVTLAVIFLILAIPTTILVLRSATLSLGSLTRAARELDPRNPDPLPAASRWAPTEVRVLADALSGMVQRLEEARTELARSESLAAVGMLTKSLAHEIRTPLSVLRAGTEILARDADTGSREEEVTRMLDSEVTRLARLMDDLLSFGRPSPPSPRPMELGAVAQDALSTLRNEARDARVTLRLEGEAVTLEADPDQMRQVVVNLVTNGVRACPDGGTVTVRTDTEGPNAILEVRDDGVGIEADRLDEIWTPLVTTHRSGHGLGLPIVRQLVEAHGGTIEVQSTLGKGTCMRVALPTRSTEKG